MSAQDRTLDQYQELMQLNSASHLLRAGRESGVFGALAEGQKTAAQLSETLGVDAGRLPLLLDALVAIGVIQVYEDDFALAPAVRLLCQYDADLGDARWSGLTSFLQGGQSEQSAEPNRREYMDLLAATQWIHTPAAMQAAEILNIGGEDELPGPQILDLGSGSAVWSCAMAHRDGQATVVAVDDPAALVAARSTAESIDLGDRFETIAGPPAKVDLGGRQFDLVLLAQQLGATSESEGRELLRQAVAASKPGARIVVIDLFRSKGRPNLSECVQSLQVQMGTPGGHTRTLEDGQALLREAGLEAVQFTFIAASKANLGMMVGVKSLVMP